MKSKIHRLFAKCVVPQRCSARVISCILDHKLVKEFHSRDERLKAGNGKMT